MNKMKRLFFLFLACTFPWIIFFMQGLFGYAVLALFLQASMIGWIPASIWAYQASEELRKSPPKLKKKPKPSKEVV